MTSAIRNVLRSNDFTACDAEVCLGPDVALALIDDGSSRLLDLDGQCFALATVSTDLLVAALSGSLKDAAESMAVRYDVAIEQVRADLLGFLKDLRRRGLVRRNTSSTRSVGNRWRDRIWLAALQTLRRAARGSSHEIWSMLALARFSVRCFGWARTVRLWERAESKPRRSSAGNAHRTIATIDRAVRECAARHPAGIECQERAIVCWRLLRELGLPARLIVGIDLYPFLGHCWCECEAQVVSDDAQRCYRFVPVIVYE